ncbi:hypothetical protein D3C76_1452140 [compost metagenome]
MLGAQGGVLAEALLHQALELAVNIAMKTHTLPPACTFEHALARGVVQVTQFIDLHAQRQSGCQNGAGAAAGDEVKPVGQAQLRVAGTHAQQAFDLGQYLYRDHAAYATAVDGQQALFALASYHALKD